MISHLKLLPIFSFAFLLLYPAVTPAKEVTFDLDHTLYDTILKEFVKEGLVDYAELQKNPHSLNRYLTGLSQVKEPVFKEWEKNQQLAYLINLYNAATLKLIVNHYPIERIKDIGSLFKGPWHQPIISLFEKPITLNTLEHEIIRTDYDEPRIHLALVCAAKGCPPLRGEAYTAEKLHAQLDDQGRLFLSNPDKFQIDRPHHTVYLSPIFKWYGKDFTRQFTPQGGFEKLNKTERAVLNYCSRYLCDPDSQFLAAGGYSVRYLDYDWSLNERKAKK
ncbi:MAG: DUF547 domain-containing protein [Planctomycetota bacterium]|jgi:hypothetical protein